MTDWTAGAQAAIARLQANTKLFAADRTLGLIDFLTENGSGSRVEMLAHGSPHFVQVVLGHVTTAVHGGGRVPKRGGWYRVRPGMPHLIDPAFAAAWMRLRDQGSVRGDPPEVRSERSEGKARTIHLVPKSGSVGIKARRGRARGARWRS